jgi:hypothetical protein
MAKTSETLTEYKGRIWACNREISEANSCKCFIDRQSNDVGIRQLYSKKIEYKQIMSPPDAFGKNKEIGQLYFMNESKWQILQLSIIRETYDSHRFHIRNNLEKLPVDYWEESINEYFSNYGTVQKSKSEISPGSPLNAVTSRVSPLRRSCRNKNYVNQNQGILFAPSWIQL